MRRACQIADGNPKYVFSRVARLTRFRAPTSTRRSGNPAGYKLILKSACRPNEQHFCSVEFLQFLRDGERRDDVSAGPPSRQNGSHGVTINHAQTARARTPASTLKSSVRLLANIQQHANARESHE